MLAPSLKPHLAMLRTEPMAQKAPSAPSDEALMERFCSGDAAAFDSLYQRYAGPLRGYLLRMAGSAAAADDLVQLTFVSVVRSRGRFLAGSRVRPWLYAIATNAARDQLRRRRGEELAGPEELRAHDEGVEPTLRDAGLETRVRNALDQLPAGQREAILLHRWEGLSFGEIAEAVGISETAAKVRAHRGYERLRELLADLKEEA